MTLWSSLPRIVEDEAGPMFEKSHRFTLMRVLMLVDVIVDLAVIVALAAIPEALSSW
jgi:hypothetical protein